MIGHVLAGAVEKQDDELADQIGEIRGPRDGLRVSVVSSKDVNLVEEKRRESGSAKVIIVRSAGHHLYLDNSDEFNEYMRKEMEETRAQTLRRRKMEEL